VNVETATAPTPTATVRPLVVERVTKRFGGGQGAVTALRAIDLSVDQGDFVAIMGPSGSGKSTLLHLMAGLTHADEGRVLVAGEDLGAMNDRQLTRFRRKHIGLVFQTFNLIPTLSAAENVALPLRLSGGANGVMDKVDAALAQLNMTHRRKHRPDSLSGGEQQRVAIARALVTTPDVILADEPTGNLDSANSRTICELLRMLNERKGATIAMVTHEPSVAIYAKAIVLLRDGQVVSQFSTEDLDATELAARYQQTLMVDE